MAENGTSSVVKLANGPPGESTGSVECEAQDTRWRYRIWLIHDDLGDSGHHHGDWLVQRLRGVEDAEIFPSVYAKEVGSRIEELLTVVR